jgi:hypothetical protein
MRIPSRFTAGDTVTWTEPALSDNQGNPVASGTHTMAFSFRGPVALSAGAGDVAGVSQGTGWLMTLPASVSGAMNVGAKGATWWWQAYAAKTGTRLMVGQGTVLVNANLALVSGVLDGRSLAEQILANIDATILARTTGSAVAEYTIGSRSMKYMPTSELLALRTQYQFKVRNERRRQGLANGLGAPDRMGIKFK